MSRPAVGCFGLILGSLQGMLVATILLLILGQQAVSPVIAEPVVPLTDATVFLSERSISRLASENLQKPTLVTFQPGGQLEVTTPVEIGGREITARLGLTLEKRGPDVISQLHWARFGFLKIPAGWLPAEVVALGGLVGETISQQIPPELSLTGLVTTADGLTFHLTWNQSGIK